MKFQRLKSIDIFRGICMVWMISTHLIDWWLRSEYYWLHSVTVMIFDPFGASGFLFVSGVSIALSYRNKLRKVKTDENFTLRTVRYTYLIRALIIFIIALIYNSFIALSLMDPSWIWTWFVLLTAAISLFIAWPLLKASKLLRIVIGCSFWIANPFIISILLPYKGSLSLNGILFHIFYSGMGLEPILVFFPFFLFGTVIGDTLFDVYQMDPSENGFRKTFGYKYLGPTIGIGSILIIFGVFFEYPNFLRRESFSWVFYSLGIDIVFISLLLSLETFEILKTKKSYKLFFYYSYYSLTIFLAHNILHFLFLEQLDLMNIWLFTLLTFIFMTIILRIIYKKWRGSASLKAQIGKLGSGITRKIEERSNKKFKEITTSE